DGDLLEPPRRGARSARAALPTRPPSPPSRAPGRGLAAHPPPLLRDAPARGRRGPAGRPGAPRPREPGHDADLHARLAGTAPGGVPGRTPPGHARAVDRVTSS